MLFNRTTSADIFKFCATLFSAGFQLAGSRRVLGNIPQYSDAIENSDYDFICLETADNLELLKRLGFKCKTLEAGYKDAATIDVYETAQYGIKIQVAVKRLKYWEQCVRLWEFLRANPEVFVHKFWKRNVSHTEITKNVDFMVTNIFNFHV